jgi:hypothetical protein
MNSLLLHSSPFTTTSEFTQNLVKSLGVQCPFVVVPFKFCRNTLMLEEIEHFRTSTTTSNSKRFKVSALVWYILMTTRFCIKDKVNNGDGDDDELMLLMAPWMSFPRELATQSFPCLTRGGLQTCIQTSIEQGA